MHRSFATGKPEKIDKVCTIADSLGAPFALPYSFELCRANVDRLVRISDDEMRDTMGFLFRNMSLALEPACVATTAALLGPLRKFARGETHRHRHVRQQHRLGDICRSCAFRMTTFDELTNIVGPKGWTSDPTVLKPKLTDWRGEVTGQAPAIFSPANTSEVAALVAACNAAGIGIVPQGGNTSLCGGAVPDDSGSQILLSMSRMNAVIEVDAANFSMQVRGRMRSRKRAKGSGRGGSLVRTQSRFGGQLPGWWQFVD